MIFHLHPGLSRLLPSSSSGFVTVHKVVIQGSDYNTRVGGAILILHALWHQSRTILSLPRGRIRIVEARQTVKTLSRYLWRQRLLLVSELRLPVACAEPGRYCEPAGVWASCSSLCNALCNLRDKNHRRLATMNGMGRILDDHPT